jgi:gamma-glutamylcyclotransferase (GGCT)/AIG2-like uncharacterized protein YtfP
LPAVDRRLLDDIVDRLDRLTGPGAGTADLSAWHELWRLVAASRPGPGPVPAPPSIAGTAAAVDEALGRPAHRLVAYGTLRPGEPNHGLLAGLGSWQPARVRGRLGRWEGYPVLVPAPAGGPTLDVMLLTSARLPAAMPGLDRFEGPAYRRSWVVAELGPPEAGGGAVVAQCYVDATADDAR